MKRSGRARAKPPRGNQHRGSIRRMAYLRVFRRVRIAPGLTMNLSKSGPSLSLGMRGAHVTVGRRGLTRTVGLPGTGVYYTSRKGWHSGVHSAPQFAAAGHPVRRHHYLAGCLLLAVGTFLALVALGAILQAAGGR